MPDSFVLVPDWEAGNPVGISGHLIPIGEGKINR